MYIFNFFHVDLWTVWGLAAQFLFFLSLVIQWHQSEKAKRSVIPKSFWSLRLAGSLMLIVYAVYRRDAVFSLVAVLQIFIYLRNIALLKNNPD